MSTFRFAEFDEGNEPWASYVERLESYFLLNEIADGDKKRAAIISSMGAKTYAILRSLAVPRVPKDLTFKEIVDKLNTHLNPQPNKFAQRISFRQCRQREGESIQEFAAKIRKASINCQWEREVLNENLLEQFIGGLLSEDIQRRLLSRTEPDLEFEDIVQKAVAYQMTTEATSKLHGGDSVPVNYVDGQKAPKRREFKKNQSNGSGYHNSKESQKAHASNSQSVCTRCGGNKHGVQDCKFPKDVECYKCGRKGHTKNVCRSSKSVVGAKQLRVSRTDPIMLRVDIDGKPNVEMELDTAAGVSTMPLAMFKTIAPDKPIQTSNVTLKVASGELIDPVGVVEVEARLGKESKRLPLYLMEKDDFPVLFGREWLASLKLPWQDIRLLRTSSVKISSTFKVDKSSCNDYQVDKIISGHPNAFAQGVGKLIGHQGHLTLKPDANPIFIRHRNPPFALKDKIQVEIERLVSEDLWEPAVNSQWATPIVPIVKSDGSLRLCGDYKQTLNRHLVMDSHPIPTLDQMFVQLAKDAKYFAKMDLREAYMHLEMDQESQDMLTVSTHLGLFRVKRLAYGISSAPGIWQRTIEQVLAGLDGVVVFFDDVALSAPSKETLFARIEAVLKRLEEAGLRLNIRKCHFMVQEIEYCGYVLNGSGIHKSQAKIEAIVNAKKPSNVTEVRAFLGLVNYYGRFFPNLSTVVHPLNQLLSSRIPFKWTAGCEEAFKKVKDEICSERVLAGYDEKLQLVLATDASPYGISAVLSQVKDGVERPISFASRALSQTEQKYSQIDKEALGIVYGVKKFFQYVYGRRFTLLTDHKPLVSIFSPSKSLPTLSATRMQHYAVYLQAFTFDIRYRNTKAHGNADALSRLPSTSESCNDLIDDAELIQLNQIQCLPVKAQDIAKETPKDDELAPLLKDVMEGKGDVIKSWGLQVEELAVQDGCLLRGGRVIVPRKLRGEVLRELHEGHFGLEKMKGVARNLIWWPRIDRDIEHMSKECKTCNDHRRNPSKATVHMWQQPTKPWQRIHVDYAGPFENRMFFVVVDALTKWPECFVLDRATTEVTTDCLDELFSRYGFAETIVSDNGSQFTSSEFRQYLSTHGIQHKLTAPYHPATNGLAERFVQTLKNGLRKSQGSLKSRVRNLLRVYRRAPHASTQKSPASMFLGREIRTDLDLIKPHEKDEFKEDASSGRGFQEGDRVLARNYAAGKCWKRGVVLRRLGPRNYMVWVEGCRWKRHIDQLVSTAEDVSREVIESRPGWDSEDEDQVIDANQGNVEEPCPVDQDPPVLVLRRSTRTRQAPRRYGQD